MALSVDLLGFPGDRGGVVVNYNSIGECSDAKDVASQIAAALEARV